MVLVVQALLPLQADQLVPVDPEDPYLLLDQVALVRPNTRRVDEISEQTDRHDEQGARTLRC